MTVPAGWDSLGCSVGRCCCCPATVYMPPTLSVRFSHPVFTRDADGNPTGVHNEDAVFNISCVWKDCPRGSSRCHIAGRVVVCCPDADCIDDPDHPGGTICTDPVSMVDCCHPCQYQLLGVDGTPDIKAVGGDYSVNGIPIVYGVPSPGDENHTETYYIVGFALGCICGGLAPGTDVGVPSYIEPDSGTACGWSAIITIVKANGDPVLFLQTNIANFFADYPNPPVIITAPMDPFKFSCCDPFHVRFFLNSYEPTWYCGFYDGSYWADPTEWPPHGGEIIPWNFPGACCNFNPGCDPGFQCDPFINPDCSCSGGPVVGPATPNPCQVNTEFGQAFGFIDITGGASCFLPRDYTTNCLDYFKGGGCNCDF